MPHNHYNNYNKDISCCEYLTVLYSSWWHLIIIVTDLKMPIAIVDIILLQFENQSDFNNKWHTKRH